MSLRKFAGKKIRLVDKDGDIFEGVVGDYIWPDDNDPEIEAIIIDNPKYPNPMEFNAEEIKSIEIIS